MDYYQRRTQAISKIKQLKKNGVTDSSIKISIASEYGFSGRTIQQMIDLIFEGDRLNAEKKLHEKQDKSENNT